MYFVFYISMCVFCILFQIGLFLVAFAFLAFSAKSYLTKYLGNVFYSALLPKGSKFPTWA